MLCTTFSKTKSCKVSLYLWPQLYRKANLKIKQIKPLNFPNSVKQSSNNISHLIPDFAQSSGLFLTSVKA